MKSHFVGVKLLIVFLVPLVVGACYYDNEQALYHLKTLDCSTINAKFSTDVLPIITANCATVSCHNSTGVGGVVLQTYDQISGKAARITQRVLIDKTMPPNGSLPTSQLNIIQCWINAGTPNN